MSSMVTKKITVFGLRSNNWEPYFSKIAPNHFSSVNDFLKLSLTFRERSPDYNMNDNLTTQTQKHLNFKFEFPLDKIEWVWKKYNAVKKLFFHS